jgi:hypothetical protein
MVKLIFKNQIIQFAGAVVIFVSLLVFCLALISFSSSWRVGIDTAMKTGWQPRIRSLHFQRYRKIIFQTHSNIKELTPYFSDFDNIGNYLRRHPCTAPFATKKSKRADTSGSTISGV